MAVSLYVRGQFELIGGTLVTDNSSFKKHLKRRNKKFHNVISYLFVFLCGRVCVAVNAIL